LDISARRDFKLLLESSSYQSCKVLNAFKEFHVNVERETDRKLKCIRSDNGGEYRGPFENYCRFHGIR
ncbi:unnamed protein product, partial [Musa hybrid cultivar]